MKREYSFNEISRITMGAPENDPKPQSQPYYTSSKPRDCWTDMRVEQIKKKYDTPSHRKNYSHYGNNQRSKQPLPEASTNNPYASYRNPLRDSVTSPNIIKRDKSNYGNLNTKLDTQYRSGWEESEHVPRFSYDSKENSNFMEKFSQIKNSMKVEPKPTPKAQIKTKDYPSNSFQPSSSSKIDPRVQNIDKINMKIKKILDCLNQNEKPRAERHEQRMDMKNSFMKGSIISKDHSEELEETKILSRQKIGYDKQPVRSNMKRSTTSNQKYLISPISSAYQYKQDYRQQSEKSKLDERYDKYSQKYEEIKKQSYEQKYSYLKNNQEKSESKNRNYEKVEDQTDSWFEPSKNGISKNRSRSCLGNFKQEQIKLNSGKKLDDQISKINVRIREFEEEKKKLNIEFKPYHCELKYNRSTSNLGEHKTQRSLKPPLPRPTSKPAEYNPSSSYLPSRTSYPEKMKTQSCEYMNRSTFQPKKQTYQLPQRYTIDNTKNTRPNIEYNKAVPQIKLFQEYRQDRQEYRPSQEYKQINRVSSTAQINVESIKFDQKRDNTSTPGFEQRDYKPDQSEASNMNTNQNTCRDEQPQPQTQSQSQSHQFSEELKLKTEEGIEQRKRKLLDTATVSFSRETKRLITNLFQQVKLDEELRNAKIWFRDLASLNKWEQLRDEAERAGIKFDKAEFEVSEEEDNPFYSVRESEESYQCLVNRWVKSEKYWQENILGQFNLREFQVEKFTEDKVDLEKKGYFVVEDLVRFLNMETGTFYRNRDLILVFRRLGSSEQLHWQQFLSKLDQQQ